LNGLQVVSPGQAQLNVGDRAVLLLANVPGAKNWRILGGDAGQIVLARDGDGKELARRGSGRFEFYVADESSLTGYRPVKGTSIYADQLGALLQAVLETGRPVLEKETIASATILPPAPIAINVATEPSEPSVAGRVLWVLIATTMAWGASRYWSRRTPFVGYRARI
jgi:hypothetical protein